MVGLTNVAPLIRREVFARQQCKQDEAKRQARQARQGEARRGKARQGGEDHEKPKFGRTGAGAKVDFTGGRSQDGTNGGRQGTVCGRMWDNTWKTWNTWNTQDSRSALGGITEQQ
jgi:hypothetical protein